MEQHTSSHRTCRPPPWRVCSLQAGSQLTSGRILAIHTTLHGRTRVVQHLVLADRQRLTCCHAQHVLHQVLASDGLRDGVLHLGDVPIGAVCAYVMGVLVRSSVQQPQQQLPEALCSSPRSGIHAAGWPEIRQCCVAGGGEGNGAEPGPVKVPHSIDPACNRSQQLQPPYPAEW